MKQPVQLQTDKCMFSTYSQRF